MINLNIKYNCICNKDLLFKSFCRIHNSTFTSASVEYIISKCVYLTTVSDVCMSSNKTSKHAMYNIYQHYRMSFIRQVTPPASVKYITYNNTYNNTSTSPM